MNKKQIDEFLPKAVETIKKTKGPKGIADDNERVSKTFRGYISQFGAAVAMGSLLSAIATLSQQGSAKEDRRKLVDAMEQVLGLNGTSLFDYARKDENNAKDRILDCALAIKLALNFFEVKEENKNTEETEGGSES